MTGKITFNSVNEFFSITFDQNGIEYRSSVIIYRERNVLFSQTKIYLSPHSIWLRAIFANFFFYCLMPKNRNLDRRDSKFMNAVPVVIIDRYFLVLFTSRNSSYDKNNKGNSGSDNNAMSPTHFAIPIVAVCKEYLILIAAVSFVEGFE